MQLGESAVCTGAGAGAWRSPGAVSSHGLLFTFWLILGRVHWDLTSGDDASTTVTSHRAFRCPENSVLRLLLPPALRDPRDTNRMAVPTIVPSPERHTVGSSQCAAPWDGLPPSASRLRGPAGSSRGRTARCSSARGSSPLSGWAVARSSILHGGCLIFYICTSSWSRKSH